MSNVRCTCRQLRRSGMHIAAVVLSLGIGMAVCGAVFSTLSGLLLAAVPGVANRSTVIHIRWLGGPELMTAAEFSTVEQELAPVLDGVVAQGERQLPVVVPSGPVTTTVAFVSTRLFETLGTVPIRGRLLDQADHTGSGAPVAVISEAFCRRYYGGDAGVVGRSLVVGGRAFVVVGLSPAGFPGLRVMDQGVGEANTPQIWLPLTAGAKQGSWLAVGGRLPARVDRRVFEARLAVASTRVAGQSPDASQRRVLRWFRAGLSWTDNPRDSLLTVGLVLIVPLCILAIACANVINLQLARATERTRELTVRLTLGASRVQLLRLLGIEIVILTVIAGGIGLIGTTLLVMRVQPLVAIPLFVDRSVLALLLVLVSLVIAATGSVPAWVTWRRVIATGLNQRDDGVPHKRLRAALVVLQVAGSVVLLFISALGLRTLQSQEEKLPVHADDILAAEFDLAAVRQPAPQPAVFVDGILARLRDHGPSRVASFATFLRVGQPVRVWLPRDEQSVLRTVYAGEVTPDWFDVMGIRHLAGRRFSESGFTDVVLNEAFASQLGGPSAALGTRLRLKTPDGRLQTREVVGVVDDPLLSPLPMALLPMPATPPSRLVLLVRTSDRATALPIVRDAILETEPLAPLDTIAPLPAKINEVFSGLRNLALVGTTLGALAVLLAAAGQYAVLAFSVRRRTREIGIRIAVGANRTAVLRLVVGHGLSVTAAGIVLGFCVTLPVSVTMRSTFLGVSPADPVAMTLVAAAMLLVGLAASFLPAYRALRVAPSVALRDE